MDVGREWGCEEEVGMWGESGDMGREWGKRGKERDTHREKEREICKQE